MRLGDTDAVHWTCLDTIWLRAHVCSCIPMHVHVYLYVSALFTEQKRKYIIHVLASESLHGTTKRLSIKSSLHTSIPLVHTLLGHKLTKFHYVFSRSLLQNKCIQSFTSIYPYLIPRRWPWPAYPCSYNGRVLIPRERSLSAGSQLEDFILLRGWYLGVPQDCHCSSMYEFLSSSDVLTPSLLMISECLITNSCPSVLNEFLLTRHESWHFGTFNT